MTAYNEIRRFKHIIGWGAILLAFGCANLEKIRHTLSEGGDYHFRKTRWGYSQAMVELSEQKQGTRLHSKKENTLIYNERIADVPIKVVYSFENDRLRVAGYLTDKPIKNAKQIHEHAAETLGEPRDFISGGSVWADYMTLIYLNGYVSHITKSRSERQFSPGLLLHTRKNAKAQQARSRARMSSGHTSIKTFSDTYTRSKILYMNSHITKRFCLMS